MPIAPGEAWGHEGLLPADAPVVDSDAALAALISELDATMPVAIAAGDLCRTLGGRGDVAERRGRVVTLLPIDVAAARLDGGAPIPFVAHLVARGRAWSGPGAMVMNAEWWGDWDVAPRAHPGDGLLDDVAGRLGWRDRLEARSRVRLAAHLPHPDLRVRRQAAVVHEFARPRLVVLDGVVQGRHRRIEAEIVGQVTVAV
jgi:hypothetical protein